MTRVQKISDWFMLGVHLGVPNEELNKIDQRFSASHGVERCKAELFDLWLRRNSSARWDDVASALEQLNEMALASELRELCQVSSPIQLCLAGPHQPTEDVAHNQEAVEVEIGKSIVRQFELLESKFASLVCNVKETTENKGVTPRKLHSFLEARLNQEIEFCPDTHISDLFKCTTPYYCFLNTTLLKSIANEVLGEPALQQQLDEYEGLLEEFTSSTKISLLKEIDFKKVRQKGMPLVVLKLSGRCLDVTIKRFQEMVQYIFGKKSSALSNIQVEDGCICITWNTRESAVPSLIDLAFGKTQFMKHVGILKLTVGEVTIFEQPDADKVSSLEDCLMQSVISGCSEAVEFLLLVGADPNHRNSDGKNVLSVACVSGSTTIAKFLIDAGATVNLVCAGGFEMSPQMSPLMLACEQSHDDIVHLLLQSGADPNFQTPDAGLVALLCVDYTNTNCFCIVRSLLEAGAQVNAHNMYGWSSLAFACNHGCYEISKLLIQYGADVQLSTYKNNTPLMIACQTKHEEIAALLLRFNADPNLQNNKNQTALMIACRRQHAQSVSLLLSSGADPNLQSENGWTALMFSFAVSVYEFDECIPVLLISTGANPNIQTKAGLTALMIGVSFKGSGLKLLLNAQADVNAQDHVGYTALHYSVSHGDIFSTELLLSAGADPSKVDSRGQTPLDSALDYENHGVCQLLLSYTTMKSPETTAVPTRAKNTTSTASSTSTTPHQELDQLRFAMRHPLPPAGTIKHDVKENECDQEENVLIIKK